MLEVENVPAQPQIENDNLSDISFAFIQKKNNVMFLNLQKNDLKMIPELDWKKIDKGEKRVKKKSPGSLQSQVFIKI